MGRDGKAHAAAQVVAHLCLEMVIYLSIVQAATSCCKVTFHVLILLLVSAKTRHIVMLPGSLTQQSIAR